MGIMTKELYAAVGYVTFIFTLFTVSTISYDEYDNGYPFLFTLPITRRQYVNEKYVVCFDHDSDFVFGRHNLSRCTVFLTYSERKLD